MKNIILVGVGLIISSLTYGQVTILEENFDSGTMPSDWTVVDNDGHQVHESVSEYEDAWIIKEDPDNEDNWTISSTSYFSPVNRADRWLISPELELGTEGNYISWKGVSYDPSFPDSYKVMISTTGNDIADFTDTLTIVNNESPEWIKRTESLEDFAGETIYIAFVNTTYDGFKLHLDSIYVREQDPLSVDKFEIQMAVYPNPSVDYITVNTGSDNFSKVSVINSLGSVINEVRESGNQMTLPTSNLNSGLYWISVETDKGIFRKKFIKQ